MDLSPRESLLRARYKYPDIPPSDQDVAGYGNQPASIRLVELKPPELDLEMDVSRAELIPHVHEANEEFIRSYHPTLSTREIIEVSTRVNRDPFWVIEEPLAASESIYVGGRAVHYYPGTDWQKTLKGSTSGRGVVKLFRDYVNPGRFRTPSYLYHLRLAFPDAVGVEFFIAGFIIILFEKWNHISHYRLYFRSSYISGLSVEFDVANYTSPSRARDAGLENQCLACRIGRYYRTLLDSAKKLRSWFAPFKTIQDASLNIPGVPNGAPKTEHGPSLSPTYPAVTGWANYSDALDSHDAYVVSQQTENGRFRVFKRVVILGTGHTWDRKKKTQKAYLMWHTRGDPALAEPEIESNSAEQSRPNPWALLCLGKPTDESSKAVVFRSFQRECYLRGGQRAVIQGGFVPNL